LSFPQPDNSDSTETREGLDGYAIRSLPLQPPQGDAHQEEEYSVDSAHDSVPSLAPGFLSVNTLEEASDDEVVSEIEYLTNRYNEEIEELHSDEGLEEEAERESVVADELSLQELRFNGNPQGMSMSMADYIDMLNELARNYEEQDFHQHQSNYYGEFYDSNPEDSYYGEGLTVAHFQGNNGDTLSGSSTSIMNVTALDLEGETVGTTATYLSEISVQQIVDSVASLQVEQLVIEIPFAEQDDPPDDDRMEAASLESDSENEQYDNSTP